MDADVLLDKLADTEILPKAALKLASKRRAEMTPLLLQQIEDYLATPPDDRIDARTAVFFGFHLLGEWREKSAYRPLARLLRGSPDELDMLFGDGLTLTVHRVMASVFDGDPQPLFDIVLDQEAEEFVRSRICEALAMLCARGDLERDVVSRFLRDAFAELHPREHCFVWYGWQCAIAMLGLEELEPQVREAFDKQYIGADMLGYEDFKNDLARGVAAKDMAAQDMAAQDMADYGVDGEYTLFGNTIEELSRWYCFSHAYRKEQELLRRREPGLFDPSAPSMPFVDPDRKIGRNDPCPCGSGKKYKKCCLG